MQNTNVRTGAPDTQGQMMALTSRIRQTPFSDRVEATGAKAFTVYNHMLLPLTFRSLEEDYYHLKEHVQLWDVSAQRQVEVVGPDAARLVQLMTPRDLSKAVPGQCLYAPLVDEKGGMLNDPIVLKLDEDRFWLSIADSDVLLWAKGVAYGMGLDVAIDEPDVSPLAIQGPKAEELAARVFGDEVRAIRFFRFARLDFCGRSLVVARSGWSKQGGFEVYLDNAALGGELWDELWDAGQDLEVGPGAPNLIERIEGGLLSYGADMTREHNPLECGLDPYCHLERDIDFIGRDALLDAARSGIKRRIVGLSIDSVDLKPCTTGWPVLSDGRVVGRVSSAAQSPHFGCGVALAMLDHGHWMPGTSVTVDAGGRDYPATVTALPFSQPES